MDHILSIGCAAAIMHRSAVDGVAVTLHRQGKNFVSGQLSHCINSPWMPGSGLLDGMFVVLTGTFTQYTAQHPRLLQNKTRFLPFFVCRTHRTARHVHVLRQRLDILPVYRSVYHGIAKSKRGEPFLIYRPFAAAPAARRERSQPWGGAASICRLCCAPVSAPVRQGRCQSPSRPAWSIAG